MCSSKTTNFIKYLFICSVFLLIFSLCFLLSAQTADAQESDIKIKTHEGEKTWDAFMRESASIYDADLTQLSSEQFINELKKYNFIIIEVRKNQISQKAMQTRWAEIKAWPNSYDIEYLLSIVDSMEQCGDIVDDTMFFIPKNKTTVGNVALKLLESIKNGVFYGTRVESYTDGEKAEIVQWAKSELWWNEFWKKVIPF